MSPLESAYGGSAGIASQVGLQPGFAPPRGTEPGRPEWRALTAGAKLEESSLQAILEGGIVRLRGTAKVIAANTLEPADALATLPVALAPALAKFFTALVSGGGAIGLKLLGAGGTTIRLNEGTVAAGKVISLDGISFDLSA